MVSISFCWLSRIDLAIARHRELTVLTSSWAMVNAPWWCLIIPVRNSLLASTPWAF